MNQLTKPLGLSLAVWCAFHFVAVADAADRPKLPRAPDLSNEVYSTLQAAFESGYDRAGTWGPATTPEYKTMTPERKAQTIEKMQKALAEDVRKNIEHASKYKNSTSATKAGAWSRAIHILECIKKKYVK